MIRNFDAAQNRSGAAICTLPWSLPSRSGGVASEDTSWREAMRYALVGSGRGIVVAWRLSTAVKLTRNALMGAVIVGVGLAYLRAGAETGAPVPIIRRLKDSLPLFVLGFLGLAILNTVGALAWLSRAVGFDVINLFRETSRAMILVALAGVGLSTRLDAMRRTGPKPFLMGLVVAVLVSGASLLLIRFLGPASG